MSVKGKIPDKEINRLLRIIKSAERLATREFS